MWILTVGLLFDMDGVQGHTHGWEAEGPAPLGT